MDGSNYGDCQNIDMCRADQTCCSTTTTTTTTSHTTPTTTHTSLPTTTSTTPPITSPTTPPTTTPTKPPTTTSTTPSTTPTIPPTTSPGTTQPPVDCSEICKAQGSGRHGDGCCTRHWCKCVGTDVLEDEYCKEGQAFCEGQTCIDVNKCKG